MRRLAVVCLWLVAACASPSPPSPAPRPAKPMARTTPAPAPPASAPKKIDACAMAPATIARASEDVKPFEREDGRCAGDQMCDVAELPPKGADACFVATSNLAKAESDARAAGMGPVTKATAAKYVRYMDRVERHLGLDEREKALLAKNGFVVLDRATFESPSLAFHHVFQEELPLYVSADSVLHAVFQANEILLMEVERGKLAPRLVKMLDRMRAALNASKGVYAAETWQDLDLYVGVAERLLRAQKTWPAHAAAFIVERIRSGTGGLDAIELFGRERMVDFSQYTPRGHYASGWGWETDIVLGPKDKLDAEHVTLADYFRAMTWLSRLELNLVSRSCRSSQPGADVDPSETPREAADAIALADLTARAGAQADVRAFDAVYSVFAGKREDLSPIDVAALGAKTPEKLRVAIGERFQRTARTHYMPEGATKLPAIATFFGARITPDIEPLEALVHDRFPNRMQLGAADVGYVLGHDRALVYLKDDLATFPTLDDALDKSRRAMAKDAHARKDVYGLWLDAVLKLGAPPEGHVPSFMKTDAFADARMGSALAAFAQIRHTFVLLAGQGYDSYGCEIPDGFVEPALATYEGLLAWAQAARAIAPERASYFRRVEQVLTMLRDISRAELDGRALTEPQRRWLGMVTEYTPRDGYGGDSGMPPKYTGWYFDLFPDRQIGAMRDARIVADYFTLTNANEVRYLGVEKTALGVFVADIGGAPRAMVGPVALAYETARPIADRLDDEAAKKLPETEKKSPWTASYVAPPPPDAPFTGAYFTCAGDARVLVTNTASTRAITVTLLDHHGDALVAPLTLPVGADPVVFAFALPEAVLKSRHGVEGFEVRSGDVVRRSGLP